MKHTLKALRPDLKVLAFAAQGPVAIGRFLLILATISLLTMPLTQHIWTWDRFLHGGQDFESGTLAIVTILCLAVLLSQLCKRHVDLWFATCRLLTFTFNHRELAGRPRVDASVIFRIEQLNGAATGIYSFPLKI